MCVVLWMCDCVVVCDAVVVAPFPLYILHPPPFALDLKVKDLMVCLHQQPAVCTSHLACVGGGGVFGLRGSCRCPGDVDLKGRYTCKEEKVKEERGGGVRREKDGRNIDV